MRRLFAMEELESLRTRLGELRELNHYGLKVHRLLLDGVDQ